MAKIKTHTFEIKEEDFETSKYRTREWERRVKIVRWEHNFEDKMYYITIEIK